MTFKELQALISNTTEGKLPTYNELSKSGKDILLNHKTDKTSLTVYKDGYITYCQIQNNKKFATVFAIDHVKWRYQFVTGETKTIPQAEYENHDAVKILTIYAEGRLMHNADSRQEYRTDFHLNNDGNDFTAEATAPDFTEELINRYEKKMKCDRLHKAISQLTARQRQVVELYFFYNKTQQQIANKIGISRSSVSDCLQGALKKLKKIF